MSNNDWVQEGTPREAEWEAEQDDYGVPLEQWDDYSAEQAVPVPAPQPRPEDGVETQQTAPDPEDVAAEAGAQIEARPADELVAGDESYETGDTVSPEPVERYDEIEEPEAGADGAVLLEPTDVYPGVTQSAEPNDGEIADRDPEFDGDEPFTSANYGEQPQADAAATEGYPEADEEPVGPDVFHEPVIADELVNEGDPIAVASPEAVDTFIDDAVHRPVPPVEEGGDVHAGYDERLVDHLDEQGADANDAGTIPAPVLADDDGEPVIDAGEAADDERAEGTVLGDDERTTDEFAEGPYSDDPAPGATFADDTFADDAEGDHTFGEADDTLRGDYDDIDRNGEEPWEGDETRVRPAAPADAVFGRPVDPAATASAPRAAGGAGAMSGSAQGGAAAGAAGATAMAGLYRNDSDQTQVIDTTTERRTIEQERAEEERIARELQAEREARDARLGRVATSDANAIRDPRPVYRKGVGGFGSFGLFLLRLVTAAIIGVIGYQVLTNLDETTAYLSQQALIPEPRLVSWIIGFGLAAMAVFLVIGLAVRVVGFLLAALAVASLVLLRWGQFSLFVENMEGFRGDLDLLLAAVGILFLSMGGGRFGIDGAFVKSRENAREAKLS